MNRRNFMKSITGALVLGGGYIVTSKAMAAIMRSTSSRRKVNSHLLKQVRAVLNRLERHGWKELFEKHGLDITAKDLAKELSRELSGIDRTAPGFEDFALDGRRAIEPGNPALSLLYHAFASPRVTVRADNSDLTAFPALAELEVIENYVFGVNPPSISDLEERFAPAPLAIAVFATEYRNAPDTVHNKNADMCYSRVGIARVGNAEHYYDDRRREFISTDPLDPHKIRVLPARYTAYIAVQLKGSRDSFGPMQTWGTDASRDFWVPVHKLFSGRECIRGANLKVILRAHHVNEKIRRIHLALKADNFDSGWQEPDIDKEPFIFTKGIAELSSRTTQGQGILIPVPHPRLIEPAKYRGRTLTFKVPPGYAATNNPASGSTLHVANGTGPELVYVRRKIENDGQEVDLNSKEDVIGEVDRGNYQAVHYLDFTGDGWIEAICRGMGRQLKRVAAYSVVGAPDFFPRCNQRELIDWAMREFPEEHDRLYLWYHQPYPLSNTRLPGNLKLQGASFDSQDQSATAIVSLPMRGPTTVRDWSMFRVYRQSFLPDSAAGDFGPGWEVGLDETATPIHLASYRLSSPFPEDLKICAAMSSYWPAVVPDSSNLYEPIPTRSSVPEVGITRHNYAVRIPLTDIESGQAGDLPWDGVKGPRVLLIQEGGTTFAERVKIEYGDYVVSALENSFSIALTSKLDFEEYSRRVKVLDRAYRQFDPPKGEGRSSFQVLSFHPASTDEPELVAAQNQTQVTLDGREFLYRLELYAPQSLQPSPNDFRKYRVQVNYRATVYVDPTRILYQDEGHAWEVRNG
jgi:hypothetical protein